MEHHKQLMNESRAAECREHLKADHIWKWPCSYLHHRLYKSTHNIPLYSFAFVCACAHKRNKFGSSQIFWQICWIHTEFTICLYSNDSMQTFKVIGFGCQRVFFTCTQFEWVSANHENSLLFHKYWRRNDYLIVSFVCSSIRGKRQNQCKKWTHRRKQTKWTDFQCFEHWIKAIEQLRRIVHVVLPRWRSFIRLRCVCVHLAPSSVVVLAVVVGWRSTERLRPMWENVRKAFVWNTMEEWMILWNWRHPSINWNSLMVSAFLAERKRVLSIKRNEFHIVKTNFSTLDKQIMSKCFFNNKVIWFDTGDNVCNAASISLLQASCSFTLVTLIIFALFVS